MWLECDACLTPPSSTRRPNEPKEIIGGFSFPVTPSSEDALQKLYKSWPSVKSSGASEHPNRMDDVNGTTAADYLDDGVNQGGVSRGSEDPKTSEGNG